MTTAPEGVRTVLHVIDALNIGGAQELLVLLAGKVPKTRFRTLVCVLQPDATVLPRITARGIPVFCLNRIRPSIFSPASLTSYFFKSIRDILCLCYRYQVTTLHCHLSDAEFIGIVAGWLYPSCRVISTVHYPELLPERKPGDMRNHLRIAVTRALYRLADTIIAVSEDIAEKLQTVFSLPPSKIKVVVNGIDIEAIHDTLPRPDVRTDVGALPGQRIVTSVGRLMPPKGHRYLVEAAPLLMPHFGNLKMLLAGDGDQKIPLEQLSRRLHAQKVISFLGSRSDIADILAISEVFVLPSLSEGTSLALLEAMAAEKPIVATDIPGNRAILKHQHNCLLVPPASPDKLAEAVAFMLDHPETAATYARNAYREVRQRFHIEGTVKQMMALWK